MPEPRLRSASLRVDCFRVYIGFWEFQGLSGFGFRVLGVQGLSGLGFRVQGLGLGFRVQGLGFRVSRSA